MVYISVQNTGVYTPPADWTEQVSFNISTFGNRIFTKLASSADIAASYFDFSFSASDTRAAYSYSNFTIYRGINITDPVTVATANTGSGTTITYLGGTSLSNSVVYALGTGFGTPGLITGFTQREYCAGWETEL